MTNKCGRTRQRTNNLRDKLIWEMISASELATLYYYTGRSIKGGSQSILPGAKAWCIIVPIAVIDIFNEKRKSCNQLIGSASFGFAQNTMHDFQNTVLNS